MSAYDRVVSAEQPLSKVPTDRFPLENRVNRLESFVEAMSVRLGDLESKYSDLLAAHEDLTKDIFGNSHR